MIDFKKYKKQILAVFSVGLMIAFAAQTRLDNNARTREIPMGHAGGYTVTNKDLERAKQSWEAVRAIQYPSRDPNDPTGAPRAVPLVDLEFQNVPGAAAAMQNNEAIYFLLQREADRMGITVTQDEVRDVLANRIPGEERVSEAELAADIEGFLKVVRAADRAAAAVRASGPEVQKVLVHAEPFSANLVEFKAADYLAKVPPYSEADKAAKLGQQYKTYRAYEPTTRPVDPVTGQPLNDFSFGYRVPNEAQVQYIGVPREAAERLVRSKITEVDAIRYYKENIAEFPTTRPVEKVSFRASPPPPGVAATTQPTTAKAVPTVFTDVATLDRVPAVGAAPMSYKDYKQKVYDEVTRKRANELTDGILADVSTVMTADFNDLKKSTAYSAIAVATSMPSTAPASQPTASVSSLGVPYTSFEYMQKLALHEQQKFELLPTIGEEQGPRSKQQLSEMKELGRATLPQWMQIMMQAQGNRQFQALAELATFPTYATSMVEPLNNGVTPPAARQLRIPTIAALEPSPTFSTFGGGAYVFRATRAILAHAAPQGEVAEQLLADARLKDAYELARQDAEKLAEAARNGSLATAAAAAGKKIMSTGTLDARAPDTGAFVIADEASKYVFLNAAYGILQKGSSEHPVGVIDFKPAASVLVGQVSGINPTWTAANLTAYQRAYQVEIDRNERGRARASWFNVDDIYRRTGYLSDSPNKRPTPTPADEDQQVPVLPLG